MAGRSLGCLAECLSRSHLLKYILLVLSGITDEPLDELDGKTPIQVARKPYMDDLAHRGVVGAVRTTPEGMPPGDDVTTMSILGYDPRRYYHGIGPIEAASLEIPLEDSDVAFRANFVSTDGTAILDPTGGQISTEEARELIELIRRKLSSRRIKFYPGAGYRNIMVWQGGSEDVNCTSPFKIVGEPFAGYMPEGDGDDMLQQLMYDSLEILNEHPINLRRRDDGKEPANMLWFWAQGRKPEMQSFFNRFGVTGTVLAQSDAMRGLGRLVGLHVPRIMHPSMESYPQYTLAELDDRDFVLLYAKAADDASHAGDMERKIDSIQNIDTMIGALLTSLGQKGESFRLLMLPDHTTPVSTKVHSNVDVPFVLYASNEDHDTRLPFDERAVGDTKDLVEDGFRLIEQLFS